MGRLASGGVASRQTLIILDSLHHRTGVELEGVSQRHSAVDR
jgi:hypothetical protein